VAKRQKRKMKNLLTGGDFVADVAAEVQCPFCVGTIVVTRTPRAVMHTSPPCPKFEAEDPLVFLRNARFEVGGMLPDDVEWPLPPAGAREDN
jgi:hypothetical protein